MSCSKERTIEEMVSKGMVSGPSLKLEGLPSSRLYDFIQDMTDKAKSQYEVDMGPLFNVRFKNVDVGLYSQMGSQSTKTNVQLEPNDAAFDAIDRSQQMEYKRILQEEHIRRNSMFQESADMDTEAQVQVVDGEVLPPGEVPEPFNTTGLVEINIQC